MQAQRANGGGHGARAAVGAENTGGAQAQGANSGDHGARAAARAKGGGGAQAQGANGGGHASRVAAGAESESGGGAQVQLRSRKVPMEAATAHARLLTGGGGRVASVRRHWRRPRRTRGCWRRRWRQGLGATRQWRQPRRTQGCWRRRRGASRKRKAPTAADMAHARLLASRV